MSPNDAGDLQLLAAQCVEALSGAALRVAVVGAVRRQQAASELELLALARPAAADLFGTAEPDFQAITDCLSRWGTVLRRSDGAQICTITNNFLAGASRGQRIVVYVVSSASMWGFAELRLTGPALFVSQVTDRLRTCGYVIDAGSGALKSRTGESIAVPDEATVFRLAGLEPVSANERDLVGTAGATSAPPAPGSRGSVSKNAIEHQGRGMPIERD